MPGWQGSTRRRRLPDDWPEIRARILDRDRHRCRLRYHGCTRHATEVDHIIRGDDHRDTNLQAACTWCHRIKSGREGAAARPRANRPPEPHPGLID